MNAVGVIRVAMSLVLLFLRLLSTSGCRVLQMLKVVEHGLDLCYRLRYGT